MSDQHVRSFSTPIYVASRASLPDRPAMWKELRRAGWNITSSWIDEAGDGETECLAELWARIESEIRESDGVILYAHGDDFPLKGALVEAGMALGMGKKVAVVLKGCDLEPRSLRPLGSWASHPNCKIFDSLRVAYTWVESKAGDCAQAWADEARSLSAEVEALKQERDKWHHRAKMLWEGYRLTEQMNMPEIERWFRGERE